MEEDFFLKNMKGVKPFKKDASIVKVKSTNKKNVKLDKKTNTKNTNKQKITAASKVLGVLITFAYSSIPIYILLSF